MRESKPDPERLPGQTELPIPVVVVLPDVDQADDGDQLALGIEGLR